MSEDATVHCDRITWSGSRRKLLAGAAGLWLPTLLPRGSIATPVPPPTASGLRDFAYICAALTLEAQQRDELKPLAGLREAEAPLFLTPEALVVAGYSQEDAHAIFAAGAKQLYAYMAADKDESRLMLLNLVEATTPGGADDILQVIRSTALPGHNLATPDLVADADNAYLVSGPGYLGNEGTMPHHLLSGGVRFGSVVVGWVVGFQAETPDLALAGAINRMLRDYLTDQAASARRGASLAFLLTIPKEPLASVVFYLGLDGVALGQSSMDEAAIAKMHANMQRQAVVNHLAGFFVDPAGRLWIDTFISESESALQAGKMFDLQQPELTAIDQTVGITRRPLTHEEMSLSGWSRWDASTFWRHNQDDNVGVSVHGLIDRFVVQVEVIDVLPAGTVTALAGSGDPALQRRSGIAQRLLAPVPLAARNASDPAARAIFPPPLPAFADPLAG